MMFPSGSSETISNRSNHLDLIVDGASASCHSSCTRQSLGKWPCHLTARQWRTDLCGCNVTLHDVLERSVVDSGTRLEQYFHATESPSADRDDVSVGEVVGLLLIKFSSRFVYCVVIPQILFNFPSKLPLCRGSERAPSVREVLQVTFVDGCCVRRIETRQSGSPSCPVFVSRPWAGGTVANMVCVVDLGSRPLRSTPRSPRREGCNTHLSKDTYNKSTCTITRQQHYYGKEDWKRFCSKTPKGKCKAGNVLTSVKKHRCFVSVRRRFQNGGQTAKLCSDVERS